MSLVHRLDGPEDAPLVVLGPSLGTTSGLWDPQLDALTRHWRVLRYELPGHRGTPVPDGPFGIDDLADAVIGLLDQVGAAQAAVAGVSLGGAIAMTTALRAPERVASLALICTSPKFSDPGPWRERAALVRREGVEGIAESAPSRWFTPFFADTEPYVAMVKSADPEGYAACCDALADFDVTSQLGRITAPTLVVAGAEDKPTPPHGHADVLADRIPDAVLTVVGNAGHLANVEQPGPVTDALIHHLTRTWKGPAA
ncbi:3-oxoadipate enol-lactonase [Actinomadura rupiterrae]|uniref:3-oxoadipate enol-lactonase n=1 Tax=Actinomadura rupiterrae TaxID=559627 RepID=UPI0020A5EC67|nr:3-oxoadipate enol-lactonase [Actinomadura rupiterrae]MCP2341652.1 3-oxoadipate enol-lactonase [Actinomadura rupiterrae]